jgi:hypothetical protein
MIKAEQVSRWKNGPVREQRRPLSCFELTFSLFHPLLFSPAPLHPRFSV